MSPEALAGLLEKIKPAFSGKYVSGIANATEEEAGGLRLTLADAQVSYTVGTGDKERTAWTTVTVAHHESANHRFPGFHLQPSNAMMEMAMRLAGFDDFDIDFTSHPAFSAAYILTGTWPANTRRLFEHAPLLDELARRPGFNVASNLSSLVLYRWQANGVLQERRAFAANAAAVFARFEEAARAAELKPALKRDVNAYAASLPGELGKRLLKSLVTRADLAAFLRQAPPRRAPANIRASGSDSTSMIFAVIGLVVALVASLVVLGNVYPPLSEGRPLMSDQFVYAALACAFVAFGIGVALYGAFAALRTQGLLRIGVLASASIEAIEPTGVRINDAEEYILKLRYPAGAQEVRAECRVRGVAVKRARQLKVEGKPAPIFYDPADPQRVMYAEALLTLDPEVEP